MMPIRKRNVLFPNALFINDFFNEETFGNMFSRKQGFSPAMNIVEVESGFRIEVAAPGFAKDEFKVDVDKDNNLLISAEKAGSQENADEKKERYLQKEFGYSQFKKTLVLPKDVDKDAIVASFENGILSIQLPKKVKEEVAETKNIEIS